MIFLAYIFFFFDFTGAFLDRIIMSFSMATNLGKIFPETNDEHMVILDMFKVTAAFGVILGHRLAGFLFYMVFNVSFFESVCIKKV